MGGHGKTLEMQAIKIPPPVPLCVCGMRWPDHLTKAKPKRRLKKYDNDQHYIAGISLSQTQLMEAMEKRHNEKVL